MAALFAVDTYDVEVGVCSDSLETRSSLSALQRAACGPRSESHAWEEHNVPLWQTGSSARATGLLRYVPSREGGTWWAALFVPCSV